MEEFIKKWCPLPSERTKMAKDLHELIYNNTNAVIKIERRDGELFYSSIGFSNLDQAAILRNYTNALETLLLKATLKKVQ